MRVPYHFLKHLYTSLVRTVFVVAVFVLIFKIFSNLAFSGAALPPTSDIEIRGSTQIQKNIETLERDKSPSSQVGLFVYRSFTCSFLGEGCDGAGSFGTRNESFVHKGSKLIAYPFLNPPASGIASTYQALENAHFIPQTQAAEGLGFGALKPFSKLWQVFRDIAYLFIVIFIVIIGFMIMFRMNIDPQTVISLENALPRLVVTLILITFSFSIAGFMIDLMMLTSSLIIATLAKIDPSLLNQAQLQNDYLTGGPWKIYEGLTPSKWWDFLVVGGNLIQVLPGTIELCLRFLALIATFPINTWIQNTWIHPAAETAEGQAVVGNSAGGLFSGIAKLVGNTSVFIVVLIITVAFGPRIVFSLLMLLTFFAIFFRIFFLLLFTYVRALLLIIFAPFILLFDMFPGRNAFKFWLKSLFGELMTFPVVIALLIVGRIMILIMTSNPGSTTPIWQPPFLFGIDSEPFAVLLGYGILFSIPNLVKILKELIGAKPLPLSFGIGTFFGGAASGGSGAMNLLGMFSSMYWGRQALAGAGLLGKNAQRKAQEPSNPVQEGHQRG